MPDGDVEGDEIAVVAEHDHVVKPPEDRSAMAMSAEFLDPDWLKRWVPLTPTSK
jgi:hypothetical protein